jgi:hypothetical protein
MIPDLAVMIAAYICFRMLEVWAFKSDRYRSEREQIAVGISGLLVIAVTVLSLIAIFSAGSGIGAPTTP